VDAAYAPDQVDDARTALGGGAHVAIDCSGSEPGRGTAIALVRERGRVVLVGEGNGLTVPDVSPSLIHPSVTIMGSWVTSIEHMRELVSRLPVWNLHPEVIVSDTFPIAEAEAAYQLADAGRSGKIALVP
jgi:threonine dehydrogenase-like Zn-dependent dehydrogenase